MANTVEFTDVSSEHAPDRDQPDDSVRVQRVGADVFIDVSLGGWAFTIYPTTEELAALRHALEL